VHRARVRARAKNRRGGEPPLGRLLRADGQSARFNRIAQSSPAEAQPELRFASGAARELAAQAEAATGARIMRAFGGQNKGVELDRRSVSTRAA
jgi:hypothetical protein